MDTIISLISCIAMLVAYWNIFSKAGEEGWKSIIPIYGTYVLYRLTWTLQMFWVMTGSFVIGFVMIFIGTGIGVNGIASLGLMVILIGIIIEFFHYHALSRAFGHGVLFTLGLLFLAPIFLLILAFGDSEYQGPQN